MEHGLFKIEMPTVSTAIGQQQTFTNYTHLPGL